MSDTKTKVTPEAQHWLDACDADPEMADAMLETAVLMELVRAERMQDAAERIEGWGRDMVDGVALMLALALFGTEQGGGAA